MNVNGVYKIIGTDQYHTTAECSYSSKVDLSHRQNSTKLCSDVSRAAEDITGVPNEKASRSALSGLY